ncbi:hypothetical protein RGQ29_004663 [Quercus rubra]|uniref:Pentatricopeptide repeat-containing protein n=1 Tax=Quercus rubra TaxID=3512 RepID=A0AAN7E2J7_QUERU|nr:hypothetical protein RGQ29_004663 [Quercus rubra]
MSLSAIRAPFFSLLLKTTELNGTTRWSLQPATTPSRRCVIVGTSVRSKNRRPLQKGRNPSIEAIQTVQALKRANIKKDQRLLDQVWESKLSRLLKLDLIAVLRELLRQNECELALKVFEDVRKEYWYKPRVSLYAEMITVLASNGLFEDVELLHSYLKAEHGLNPEIEGFNALFKTLISFNRTELAMECYHLMKEVGCEPDKSSFRIIITGLELNGETKFSAMVRQDAQMYYGECLEFLEEEEIVKQILCELSPKRT